MSESTRAYKRLMETTQESIYEEIHIALNDINKIVRPSSRVRLRRDIPRRTNAFMKEKRVEDLLSLRSFLTGLRLGANNVDNETDSNNGDDYDAKIEEYAAYYFVYDYVMKMKPPKNFSTLQKEAATAAFSSILSNEDLSDPFYNLWPNTPSYWKQCDEVVFAACYGSHLTYDPNPKEYPCLYDKKKILKMIMKEKINWDNLPGQIQEDRSFAQTVLQHAQPSIMDGQFWINLMCELFTEHRDLLLDRNFWLQTLLPNCKDTMECIDDSMRSGFDKDESDVIDLLLDLEPINLDREVMSKAMEIHVCAFSCLHENLKNDNQFILENVTKFPGGLHRTSTEWLCTNKNLVMKELLKKFQCSKSYNDIDILHILTNTFMKCGFWNDEEFTSHWFQQGFPLLIGSNNQADTFQPQSWSFDKDKLLNVAHYCRQREYVIKSFENASSSLRNDLEFFRQVIRCNKYAICCASKELRQNDDLMADAIASCPSFLKFYKIYNDDHDDKYFLDLQSRLCIKLDLYDSFYMLLRLISCKEPWCLLNQGEDTSKKYKKVIAEFLNVTLGQELQLVRRAYEHLNRSFQK